MKRNILFLFIICNILPVASKQISNGRGFYKDIFMDSGVHLTSRRDLPAARFLDLQMEYFAGERTLTDTIFQTQVFEGSAIDENGVLLYPDGAPRFRMVYVNGGLAETHGRSLTDKARQHYKDFVANGGSYLGTCAGAYFSCKGVRNISANADTIHYWPHYLGIWPGATQATGMIKKIHNVVLEKKSPLKQYFDFGKEGKIDSVYHNGGCFADVDSLWPKGTEILARYDTKHIKTKKPVDGTPVIWAYKANNQTGRIIPCGSHPEGVTAGERLQLMSSMIRYALDGNGDTRIKAELELQKPRKMTAWTHDNKPEFTKIGDKQYHHFTVNVPEEQDSLVIQLKSLPNFNNYDMYLFVSDTNLAWKEEAQYQDISLGFDKKIVINKPKAKKYYISVYCATTVETYETAQGTGYKGRLDVLNGVPYIISVNNY